MQKLKRGLGMCASILAIGMLLAPGGASAPAAEAGSFLFPALEPGQALRLSVDEHNVISASVVPAGAGADHALGCAGLAPTVNDCYIGADTSGTSFNYMALGMSSPFVGDLQIVEHYGRQDWIFTCSGIVLVQNVQVHCSVVGSPIFGGVYTTGCYARAFSTANPSVPGSGLTPATGSWSCSRGP